MKSSHVEPPTGATHSTWLRAPTQLETAKASAPDPLPGPQPNPDAKFLNSPAANSQKGHPEVKPSKPTKQPTPVRTRSGRVIKEPVRFQDYGVT